MFIGEYQHSLDPKKRVSIPTKMRRELGDTVVVTRGLDQCLFVYPQKEWDLMAEKLSKLSLGQADSRNFVRLMLAGAAEEQIDSLGRILVPDYLKKYAGLDNKAVIVGVYNRIEIWSPDRWEDVRRKSEENADVLAEKLGELGMY
ncbi:MAG: division/cell wall cluster transcriptional repressor MraZ [Patescibacteria group bacterium]